MEKLQCEICGGSLVMQDGMAVCESCGMKFSKEEIKKMVVELSGPVKIDGPVQVTGIDDADTLAGRAEDFFTLGDTEKAGGLFQQFTDKYPTDYRGWWGLARTDTWRNWEAYFDKYGGLQAQMPDHCKRAIQFSDERHKAEVEALFADKLEQYQGVLEQRRQAQKNDNIASLQNNLNIAQSVLEQYEKNIKTCCIKMVAIVVMLILAFFLSRGTLAALNEPGGNWIFALFKILMSFFLVGWAFMLGLYVSNNGTLFHNLKHRNEKKKHIAQLERQLRDVRNS